MSSRKRCQEQLFSEAAHWKRLLTTFLVPLLCGITLSAHFSSKTRSTFSRGKIKRTLPALERNTNCLAFLSA